MERDALDRSRIPAAFSRERLSIMRMSCIRSSTAILYPSRLMVGALSTRLIALLSDSINRRLFRKIRGDAMSFYKVGCRLEEETSLDRTRYWLTRWLTLLFSNKVHFCERKPIARVNPPPRIKWTQVSEMRSSELYIVEKTPTGINPEVEWISIEINIVF